jgi:thiamine biosynthesis lipoprotein
MKPRRLLLGLVVLAATAVLALGLRAILAPKPDHLTVHPVGIMGTSCTLTAVPPKEGGFEKARGGADAAEHALRRVEALMSTYIGLSELSRLNAAPPGRQIDLSPETVTVLHLAEDLRAETAGTFDVTCLPLFRLWAQAGKANRMPTEAEIEAAQARCGWDKWAMPRKAEAGRMAAGKVSKLVDGAGIGLGGLAKGWAVDRAVEAMKEIGCPGGLVEVGGDLRCFGAPAHGGKWLIGLRNPFDPHGGEFFGTLAIGDGAVCTSGNYERFSMIDGKRYSHIVDPRAGRPVDFAPSVTVVADSCAIADGWATALSVLGAAGFKLLPPGSGVEALIITGGPDDYQVHQTPGFARLLSEPVPLSKKSKAASNTPGS